MRGLCFGLLLALAACAATEGATSSTDTNVMRGWQTAMGHAPSKAEFAAVYAACQDRLPGGDKGGLFEGCLADLGLRRVPQGL